jgi:hypothetical protein
MAEEGGANKRSAGSPASSAEKNRKKKAKKDAKKKEGCGEDQGDGKDVNGESVDESEKEENPVKTLAEELMEEMGITEHMKQARKATRDKQSESAQRAIEEIAKAIEKLPDIMERLAKSITKEIQEKDMEDKIEKMIEQKVADRIANMDVVMSKEMEGKIEKMVEKGVVGSGVKEQVDQLEKKVEESQETLNKIEKKGDASKDDYAKMLKKGEAAAKAVEKSKKEMDEMNNKTEADMKEVQAMANTCKEVTEKQRKMDTTVEDERNMRLKGSFEMTGIKGKAGNMAELSEVKKDLGTGAEVRGREDAGVKKKLKENIMKVLEEKYGAKVEEHEIEGQEWRGRDEGRVHFKIKGETKIEEVCKAVMGRWKEGSENVNAFVNQEVTWERQVRMKILRTARQKRTIEKWYQETDGGIHFNVMEKDENTQLLQGKINVRRNGKKEVWVTPHRTNNWRMMTERDLLEAMHLVDETGVTPNDAKNIRNFTAEEGHAVAVGRN